MLPPPSTPPLSLSKQKTEPCILLAVLPITPLRKMRKPHAKEYENDGHTFNSLEEHWTNLEGMMTLNKRTTMMVVLAKNKKKMTMVEMMRSRKRWRKVR